MRTICLILYYGIFRWFPASYTPILGKISKRIRYNLCKRIFKSIGHNVNIEKGAFFGNGKNLIIGHNSGLGINSTVPNDIIIGENVMMGPNCYIFSNNHDFSKVDIPMCQQGITISKQTIIELVNKPLLKMMYG